MATEETTFLEPFAVDFDLEEGAMPGAENVLLIAHSMGNLALTTVLRRFSTEAPRPWNQIVLVAPDIDADQFVNVIMPGIQDVGDRITLYASGRDRALNLSQRIHGGARAGDIEGEAVAAGFDTIDASDVATDLVGHSYHATSKQEIVEIHQESVARLLEVKEAVQQEGLSQVELSWGDTPTCSVMDDFSGLDEIRPRKPDKIADFFTTEA